MLQKRTERKMPQSAASLRSWRQNADEAFFAGNEAKHVVVVDDDDPFRESLLLNLEDEGYQVTAFPNGEQALDFFFTGGDADVLLLDWKMPGIDGLEVLRRIRASNIQVPVIFLTVLSDEIYEEAALAGGAVDFIEKSRSFKILLRRIGLIGEVKGVADGRDGDDGADVMRIGKLQLRPHIKRAHWNGTEVELTAREYDIVDLLSTRAGRDVTYRDIYDTVHGKGFVAGYGTEGYRANVRTFIKRIRRKFKDIDNDFAAIENFPGFGYRWRVDA
jgi:two-component system response regulator ChvI